MLSALQGSQWGGKSKEAGSPVKRVEPGGRQVQTEEEVVAVDEMVRMS